MRTKKTKLLHLGIQILSFLPALLLLCMIFGFSAQTGEESGSLSFQISLFLVKLFSPFLPAASTNEILIARAEAIHFFVRKAAHMTEYFFLTLSLQLPMQTCLKHRFSFSRRLFLGLSAAVIFAATDELHQSFVAGRSGNIADVCIDSVGIFLASLILFLFSVIAKRRRTKA